jgi:hypothetical protein
METVYRDLLGRPSSGLEDNIKINGYMVLDRRTHNIHWYY